MHVKVVILFKQNTAVGNIAWIYHTGSVQSHPVSLPETIAVRLRVCRTWSVLGRIVLLRKSTAASVCQWSAALTVISLCKVLSGVCVRLSVFHTISQTPMQLGSRNYQAWQKCSTMSPGKLQTHLFWGQNVTGQGHEAQKHSRRGVPTPGCLHRSPPQTELGMAPSRWGNFFLKTQMLNPAFWLLLLSLVGFLGRVYPSKQQACLGLNKFQNSLP